MHYLKTFAGLILILFLFSFSSEEKNNSTNTSQQEKAVFPAEVHSVLKKSCFDCHSDEAKKILSKSKLNFDKLDELSEVKMIATLKKVEREIKEDKMPPKKYIQKNPEKNMTEDEKTMIFEWIKTELDSK